MHNLQTQQQLTRTLVSPDSTPESVKSALTELQHDFSEKLSILRALWWRKVDAFPGANEEQKKKNKWFEYNKTRYGVIMSLMMLQAINGTAEERDWDGIFPWETKRNYKSFLFGKDQTGEIHQQGSWLLQERERGGKVGKTECYREKADE